MKPSEKFAVLMAIGGFLLILVYILTYVVTEKSSEPRSLYYSHADSTTNIVTPSGIREIVWFEGIPTLCYDSGEEKGWIQVRPLGTMIFNVPNPLFLDDKGCDNS